MIYESPDGGETVYVRESGSTERQLHSVSEQRKNLMQDLRKNQFWGNIHRAAKTDSGLAQILEQAEIYYKLKYQDSP